MLKHKQILLITFWCLAIGLGLHSLLTYKGKPGNPGRPPSTWPRNEVVSLPSKGPLLVMFAHPRCPCTKASLAQLEQLAANAKDQFEGAVLFYEPSGGSKAWLSSALIDKARSIPGVRVGFDPDATLARKFRVATSGHILVYSAEGRLLFSGGITGSRGHLGDNAGYGAVLTILCNHSTRLERRPRRFLDATSLANVQRPR